MLCFIASGALSAATIDFEGLPDSTILTNQYPGLTFSDAIILTAGISLNEFEFPPHSGENVASDNNGPMTIAFATPVTSVSGYFTYSTNLFLTGYGTDSNPVVMASSAFTNNEALSGDMGSTPNEFIQLNFVNGISAVRINGDPDGGSFTLDDLSFTSAAAPVPEPNGSLLLIAPLSLLFLHRATRRRPLYNDSLCHCTQYRIRALR